LSRTLVDMVAEYQRAFDQHGDRMQIDGEQRSAIGRIGTYNVIGSGQSSLQTALRAWSLVA
jgi:hypothetical protein